jgi:hypothetical protein
MKIDRRAFLKKAGIGSVALASLPVLADTLAKPAWAQGRVNFHLLSISVPGPQGAQPPGSPGAPQHQLAMGGQGNFDPTQVASKVSGGGYFVHWLFPGANPPPGGTPLTVVASGTWGNGRLVSYKQAGTIGVQAAGVLQMVIDMFREVPSKAVMRGASLKIVCAVGAAGIIIPGELEGFTLSVPGTEFSAGGNPGPFTPVGAFPTPRGPGHSGSPGIGFTAFSLFPVPS